MIGQLHDLSVMHTTCQVNHLPFFSFTFELKALALCLWEYKVFNFMSVKGLLLGSLNLIYRYKADKGFPCELIARAKQKKKTFIP